MRPGRSARSRSGWGPPRDRRRRGARAAEPARSATPKTRAFVVTASPRSPSSSRYAGMKGAYISTSSGRSSSSGTSSTCARSFSPRPRSRSPAGSDAAGRSRCAAVFTRVRRRCDSARTSHVSRTTRRTASRSLAFANRELGVVGGNDRGRARSSCASSRSSSSSRFKLPRDRGSRAFTVRRGGAALVVVAWSLTGQVYAAEGERRHSPSSIDTCRSPTTGSTRRRVGSRSSSSASRSRTRPASG